jgi:hypothetical protein
MEVLEPGDSDWMPIAEVQVLNQPGGLDRAYRTLVEMRDRWVGIQLFKLGAQFRFVVHQS